MARNGRNTQAGNGGVHSGEAHETEAAGTMDGVASARQWMSASLASLNGLATWLEQVQSLNGSALAGWTKALELCARDIEQVTDAQQLVALPAKMANHQFEEMSRHLGSAFQELFAAEVRWAEDWRKQLTDQIQQAGSSVTESAGLDGGSSAAPMAVMGQLQDQWLAMGQKWLDMMGGTFSGQARASAH